MYYWELRNALRRAIVAVVCGELGDNPSLRELLPLLRDNIACFHDFVAEVIDEEVVSA